MRWFIRLVGVVGLGLLTSCGSDEEQDPRKAAAAFARDDIACTQDSDCCVVFEGCYAEGYVVGAKDKDEVKKLLNQVDEDECLLCIPPTVQVFCGPAGTCVGQKLQCSEMGTEGFTDHCGKLPLPSNCVVQPETVELAPGTRPQKILGCGP